LIEHGENINHLLIQVTLSGDKRVSLLANLVLTKRNASRGKALLFHNHQEILQQEGAARIASSGETDRRSESYTPTQQKVAPAIQGARFRGFDSDGEGLTFEFRSGGKLTYTNERGTFHNASWKQSGEKVEISVNNGFATYSGVVRGELISGTGQNSAGAQWTWEMVRQ
jgi:hypothetical protein